jgi:hypothetical protein
MRVGPVAREWVAAALEEEWILEPADLVGELGAVSVARVLPVVLQVVSVVLAEAPGARVSEAFKTTGKNILQLQIGQNPNL